MPEDEEQDNLDLYGPDDDEDVLYDDNEEEDEEPATVDAMIPSSTTNVLPIPSISVSSATATLPTTASSLSASPVRLNSATLQEDALAKKIAEITGTAEPSFGNNNGGGFSSGLGASSQHNSGDGLGGVRPRDMPDEGKMFVGGLNWETSDDNLRSYFSQFGSVEHCTIMRDPTGRSRGFAFLTFEEASSVDKVLGQEHQLDGKQIDPKRAIPHTEHKKSAKIFVGGLLPSTTVDVLREFFSQYGTVLDAQVMVDRESSRSKGFGFITFADEESCDKCLLVGMVEIDGKGVEVKRAQPRNGREGSSADRKSNKSDPYGGSVSYNGVPSSLPQNPLQQQMLSSQQQQQQQASQQASFMMPQMNGMMPGMMGMGGGAGGMDPNVMVQMYQRMMSGGMGVPGQMGMLNRPQMINPGLPGGSGFPGMMSSPGMFNPMMAMGGGVSGGGASPNHSTAAARPMMGMPMMGLGMGMMGAMNGMNGLGGMRPGMGMAGMPFMMAPPAATTTAGTSGGRPAGGRSPSIASQGQQQQQQQGMGPARFNTKGQSHFRPY